MRLHLVGLKLHFVEWHSFHYRGWELLKLWVGECHLPLNCCYTICLFHFTSPSLQMPKLGFSSWNHGYKEYLQIASWNWLELGWSIICCFVCFRSKCEYSKLSWASHIKRSQTYNSIWKMNLSNPRYWNQNKRFYFILFYFFVVVVLLLLGINCSTAYGGSPWTCNFFSKISSSC